jgi:hypothetical protein
MEQKQCACGAIYSPETWACLHYVGDMESANDGYFLELRDCGRCSSTIAIEVSSERVQ